MTSGDAALASAVARAAELAALGGGPALSPEASDRVRDAALTDPDARVRAAAVAALVRVGIAQVAVDVWNTAIADRDSSVRRRTAEMAPALIDRVAAFAGPARKASIGSRLVACLADADVTVVEAAAWAFGEQAMFAIESGAVEALADATTTHPDAIAREAAVAALGAIGDPAGLPAILGATQDKPTVRRRAVLALAPFEGADVDAALARALDDRDWQVRQAAEDLTPDSRPGEPRPGEPRSGDDQRSP